MSGKSSGLAGSVWDKDIAGGGRAATAMIKMALWIGEPAGQTPHLIGLTTTDYLDY